MTKLLKRKEIEDQLPQLKGLSFHYWSREAGVRYKKRRSIKSHLTHFYLPSAVRKLEAVLRSRKPGLFKRQPKPQDCRDEARQAV